MKIVVDADACPVSAIVTDAAIKRHLDIVFVCDYHHMLSSDYGTIITVDKGQDCADHKILSILSAGDVLLTQDYGLASIALVKGAYVLHPSGMIYDKDNIDRLLYERFLHGKERKSSRRIPHMKKRTADDDICFKASLEKLLDSI